MAATTWAAKAALCRLDRPLSHDCALQDVARALASLSSAVAMRDEAAVHGTRSDLDTARGALYEIRVSLATADHKASVQVLRLTEMVVDPEAFTEENVEHVASLAREQLVVVSKLEVEEGELCSKVQTLQAVKPPRHQIFTSAAAAADAVMVYVPLSSKSSSDQTATSFGKVGPSTFPCMGFDSTSDGRVWRALVPSRKLGVAEAGAPPPRLMDGVMMDARMRGAPELNKPGLDGYLFMIRAMEWGVHDDDPSAEGWKLWLRAANAPNQRVVNSVFRTLQERYLSVCNSTERQPLERGVSS